MTKAGLDQVRRLGARAAKRVEIILGCPRDSKEMSAFCLRKHPHAAFRSRLCILLDCEVNEWHATIGCTLFPPESRSTRCLAVAVKLVKQTFGTLLASFALFVRAAQAAKWSSSTRLSSGSLHTQLNTEALQRPATLQIGWWQAGSRKLPRQSSRHYTQSILVAQTVTGLE